MKEKKKLVCSLISSLMIFSLALPLPSSVVEASAATEIRDWHELHAIRDNLGGHYLLMNDLDATTAGYQELASPTANQGQGWEPIGTPELYDLFTGTFDGQGYEIKDFFVGRPEESGVGLFRAVEERAVIGNVGVVNANVTGDFGVGGLVGLCGGTVSNSYATGSVTGNSSVGGLVGHNMGTVRNCYSNGNVTGDTLVGGLTGYNVGDVGNSYSSGSVTGYGFLGGLVGGNEGTVSNCYSSGRVTGEGWYIGGLVGHNWELTVSNCYSSGNVTGDSRVGGLVGENTGTVNNCYSSGSVAGNSRVGGLLGGNEGTVSNSYSSGSVTGEWRYVGGLVGHNWELTVSNCYSSGNVTGDSRVGGLVGENTGTVNNCYCSGSVAGNSVVGGLVGGNHGTVSNCYSNGCVTGHSLVGGLVGGNERAVSDSLWDRETSGMQVSDGGMGKTTVEMQDIAIFLAVGWDIYGVAHGETDDAYAWNIVGGESYPFLSAKRPREYDLTISGTAGGSVAVPGEGVYTYHAGAVVALVGEPEEGYRFVDWIGDVDTIGDVNAAETSITMQGNYTVTANFERPVNWALIGGIVAAVVVAGLVVLVMLRRRRRAAGTKGC